MTKSVNLAGFAAGPAFRAYRNTGFSFTSTTRTKLPIDMIVFDTSGKFNTTLNRFQPDVAGYYAFTATALFAGSGISAIVTVLTKNGVDQAATGILGSVGSGTTCTVADTIFLNGSTDYVEFSVQLNGGSPSITGGSSATWFAGHLVRAA